jgi:hypothetical protein
MHSTVHEGPRAHGGGLLGSYTLVGLVSLLYAAVTTFFECGERPEKLLNENDGDSEDTPLDEHTFLPRIRQRAAVTRERINVFLVACVQTLKKTGGHVYRAPAAFGEHIYT